MSTQERFDLVILGSGSTAFAAALHAAELGKTVAMTEERRRHVRESGMPALQESD